MRPLLVSLLALAALFAPAARAARPLAAVSGRTIVIDPGHNPGNGAYPSEINRPVDYGLGTKPCDTTGTSTRGGYAEARYTYDVSLRLRAMLQAAGAKVILTHTLTSPAYGPCITERAAIGNRAHAAAAISIHAVYRSNYYGGLDWSHVPKVLLETGNMRNEAEAARLESASVRQRIARGIALGLARFLSE